MKRIVPVLLLVLALSGCAVRKLVRFNDTCGPGGYQLCKPTQQPPVPVPHRRGR